ncbi:PAS domain-containing sensor histidine kinase [Ekhidna sp.]
MEFTIKELEKFAHGTEVFMAILTIEGVVVKANDRWFKRFKIEKEDLVGRPITKLIHDSEEQRFVELIEIAVEERQICHEVISLIDQDLQSFSFQFDLTYQEGEIYLVGFDVTDHAKEHLSLVDMSKLTNTGAWYYDPIRDKTYWSEEVYNIHDLPVGSDVNAGMALSFYTGKHKDEIDKLVKKLYENFEMYDYTGEITSAKGKSKWIRTIAKPMIHEGKIIYICGVTADRTRLHNNLERIKKESETRLLALKGIKSGLFDHDLQKDVVFYSPDFKDMVGLSREGEYLPEAEFRKMIHPDDRDEAYQRHMDQLDKEGNHYFNHYRLQNRHEEYEYYEVHAWRKKDKEGIASRMVGNLINVNDRVLAEQEKTRTKNSLEAMVDNGFIYSLLLSKNGTILMADYRSIEIIEHEYGVNPRKEEVKYENVMPDVFKKPYREEFEKAMKGMTIRKEIERPVPDGSMQWLDVMYRPIKNEDEEITYVLTNLSDITKRKRAEMSIKEAKNYAMSLNRLKSGILSNLSHEMRTPLNGIMGTTELLMATDLGKEEHELLQMQKDSEKRLLKTLNDLITLSDLDSMRLNMRLKECKLNDLVQKSFDTYHHMANKKSLGYTLQKSDREAVVLVDQDMIAAALNAVIHNAIKYTNGGQVSIECNLDEQEWAEIKIKDTGVGIDSTNYERIFEDFEKVNIGLNYKYEGAGIGLSIANKFIQLMGGSIVVHSVVNEGSQFEIKLPAIELISE